MSRRGIPPRPNNPRLINLLNNLSLNPSPNTSLSKTIEPYHSGVIMSNPSEDSSPDEGFHEPRAPSPTPQPLELLSREQFTGAALPSTPKY
jgi:hypothetical protein